MIGPFGKQGPAVTLRHHCPQMTQRRCTCLLSHIQDRHEFGAEILIETRPDPIDGWQRRTRPNALRRTVVDVKGPSVHSDTFAVVQTGFTGNGSRLLVRGLVKFQCAVA